MWLDRCDRALGRVIDGGRWLALAVAALLFLQWPLRDLVQAYSREANDLAQWIFALYVCMAVPQATRAGSHLATDAFARRLSPAARARIGAAATLLAILPWTLFILIAGWPTASRSVVQLEAFPDTFNPGYFVVKAGACVLALLMLLQALIDLAKGAE
ncbi:hypothetical protein TSO352_09585 [Azospirillum sp. TSO35-2]|nr:hypothetical protein TSO352_09585 [Azospirillum sp. TSO35-2]